MKPIFLSEKEAQDKFDIKQYDPLGLVRFNSFVLFDDTIVVNQNLEESTFEELFFSKNENIENSTLFIINGNLTVNGDINISESMPCLLVLGDVYCDVLHSFDNVMHINGNAHIKYAFNGNYNHGSITIKGVTNVPFLLNSDHDAQLNPAEKTIKINYYSNWDDFFTYDYYSEDLSQILIKEALDSGDEFNYEQFIKVLKSGQSPIKKGTKPSRLMVRELIDDLAEKSKDEESVKLLDLTDKKLKTLPNSIFEIESLEELILEENGFTTIPPEIGNLKNLKVLNLKKTNIDNLPNTIGQLENLEVLNLSHCNNLKMLPSVIGNLKRLKKLTLWCFNGEIPNEINQLTNLEELDIYGWYQHVEEPVEFPEWIFELSNLKTLKINNNSFKNLPKKILELKKLETLHMNSALCFVKEFPDLSQLNLKELEADGRVAITTRPHVQHDILQHYFKIKTLERLRIDSFGEEEKYMNANDIQKIKESVQDNPEKLTTFKKNLRIEERELMGRKLTKYFYTKRRAIQLDDFKGLDNLTNLKYLDIAWNKLKQMPPEILKLENLEHIKLKGNKFSEAELNTLKELNPKIVIE